MKCTMIGFEDGELVVETTLASPKVYTMHTDPGHGWLEVDRAELVALGILGDISPYSYQRGDKVYLEEDCDFSRFLLAKEAIGEHVGTPGAGDVVESYRENTPIRGYKHFQA